MKHDNLVQEQDREMQPAASAGQLAYMPEMKKKWPIALIALAVMVLLYIGLRETLVVRATADLDDSLTVHLAFDQQLFAWLDPLIQKDVQLNNKATGASLAIELESIEWDLYFHIDSNSTGRILRITDKYLGQNEYDYATLKLLQNQEDCFSDFNGYGGFNDQGLAELGQPTLTYDHEGFRR